MAAVQLALLHLISRCDRWVGWSVTASGRIGTRAVELGVVA